jgi:para-aminobenzoate synthetase component 1
MPYTKYLKAFNKVQKNLLQGNSYLLNLTFPTRIRCNLTLKDIFLYARAPYKIFFQDQFVVFSPEPFIRIQEGKVTAFPMKGTIDASIPDAENLLLSNPKELSEHLTVVDLLRNDLNRIAKNITVTRFREISSVVTAQKTILQTSSHIQGELPSSYQQYVGDILGAILPAGSICGAPKVKTLQVIKSVERYARAYYTGVCGYFDGKNLESAVMIRYIEKKNNQLYYKSGGGITMDSDPVSEYQEMLGKVYVPIY